MRRREMLALMAGMGPELGGRGCFLRAGQTVRTWGDQTERKDVLSSAKPVMTTLLFFAMQEGKLRDLEARIGSYDWALAEKDRGMTFAHLSR